VCIYWKLDRYGNTTVYEKTFSHTTMILHINQSTCLYSFSIIALPSHTVQWDYPHPVLGNAFHIEFHHLSQTSFEKCATSDTHTHTNTHTHKHTHTHTHVRARAQNPPRTRARARDRQTTVIYVPSVISVFTGAECNTSSNNCVTLPCGPPSHNLTCSGNIIIFLMLFSVQIKGTSDPIEHLCGESGNTGLPHDDQGTYLHLQFIQQGICSRTHGLPDLCLHWIMLRHWCCCNECLHCL